MTTQQHLKAIQLEYERQRFLAELRLCLAYVRENGLNWDRVRAYRENLVKTGGYNV